jgi:hypothetical protein
VVRNAAVAAEPVSRLRLTLSKIAARLQSPIMTKVDICDILRASGAGVIEAPEGAAELNNESARVRRSRRCYLSSFASDCFHEASLAAMPPRGGAQPILLTDYRRLFSAAVH